MKVKKRIGLLALVIFTAGIIMSYIDALVTVVYNIIPEEVTSTKFTDLVLYGPIWWKINVIISVVIISVGIISYLLGADMVKYSMRKVHRFDFLVVILTFVIISASGLGDVIAQTFIEIIRRNNPVSWIGYEWWWTKYMPLPGFIAFVLGLNYPTGTIMLTGSIIGVILLIFLWFYYFKIYGLKKKRKSKK